MNGSDPALVALGLAVLVVLVLQLVLLLRRPRVEFPPEWDARLQALERAAQGTLQGVARSDGALSAMGARLQDFTGTSTTHLGALRQAVDERLAQAIGESRAGRAELMSAFGSFEAQLAQHMGALGSTQSQRLAGFEVTLTGRLDGLQQLIAGRLDANGKSLAENLARGQADAAVARRELSEMLAGFRAELTTTAAALTADSVRSRTAMAESTALFEQRIQERFESLTAATQQTLDSLKADLQGQLGTMSGALADQLAGNGQQIRNQFTVLQDAVSQQLAGLVQGTQHSAEQLRSALNERLAAIQADNTAKLEEMRRTVDEKLHATLEQRLGASFKLVSERLEQVHKGLGEMQNLAQGVGDLKHLLSNVKTRGMFGEAQLATLLEQVFAPDQYATQVATRPGSRNAVDFAIRLPGRGDDGAPCWLPIDAKFPNEDYERLLDAQQRADAEGAELAARALEQRIRMEARSMAEKYLEPPHTTDFAILFLPTEGLYAEVLRRPGLMEALQREHRVTLTGPTTLMAMLNALQMGFRTLALEKRSSEVWQVLGAVKTEFGKFGDVLARVKSQTQTVLNTLDAAETRSRAMGRALKTVEALPQDKAQALLPADPTEAPDADRA
ncbi:MAG: DNA recombination protein RmuC [Burkholderiaceae bacterium]|nr:DNA recombination protein RmuC [Burkholderiaceae bacterium]